MRHVAKAQKVERPPDPMVERLSQLHEGDSLSVTWPDGSEKVGTVVSIQEALGPCDWRVRIRYASDEGSSEGASHFELMEHLGMMHWCMEF